MSPFAETRPHFYTPESPAEQESAKRRAVVFGLVLALTSVLLSVGAIATAFMALG